MARSLQHFHQQILSFRQTPQKVFSNYYAAGQVPLISLLQEAVRQTRTPQAGSEQWYMWGVPGVGKSHLLQALCYFAEEQGRRSIYLPFEECFKNPPHNPAQALDGLKEFDVICFDDVDCLANTTRLSSEQRSTWQYAVFDFLNSIRHNHKLLVLAGHTPPLDIAFALPDLAQRLAWGGVYQIQAVGDAHKPSVLKQIAEHNQLECPEQVIHYLMHHHSRDLGELIHIFTLISRSALREKARLTIPFVKQILAQDLSQEDS